MKTASREEMIRLTFSTSQKRISKKEQRVRKEVAAGIETLIAHLESMFPTYVDAIELYPCPNDCEHCQAADAAA